MDQDLNKAVNEAERILKEAEAKLGLEHPIVAECLDNLAGVLSASGGSESEVQKLRDRADLIRGEKKTSEKSQPVSRPTYSYRKEESKTASINWRLVYVLCIGVVLAGVALLLGSQLLNHWNHQELKYRVLDFEKSDEYSSCKFHKVSVDGYTAYLDESLNTIVILQTTAQGEVTAFQVNRMSPSGSRRKILTLLQSLLVSVDPSVNMSIADLDSKLLKASRNDIISLGTSKVFNTLDPRTQDWNGFGCNTKEATEWTADKNNELLKKLGYLAGQLIADKEIAKRKNAEKQVDSTKISAAEGLRTYIDFERSGIFKTLGFKAIKTKDSYRIYRDRNNNFIAALQIGKNSIIDAVRIMPMPVNESPYRLAGLWLLTAELAFGDGASKDPLVLRKVTSKERDLSDGRVCEFGAFHAYLVKDPSQERTGIQLESSAAAPWTLSFASSSSSIAALTTDIPASEAKDDESDEVLELRQRNLDLSSDLGRLKSSVAIKEQDLKNQVILAKEEKEKLCKTLELSELRNKQLMDSDIEVISTLNSERETLLTELARANVQGRFQADVRSKGDKVLSVPEVVLQPPESDDYVSVIPGFDAKEYREDVESRIRKSIKRVGLSYSDNVSITFKIKANGIPQGIVVESADTAMMVDEEQWAKKSDAVQQMIYFAAPFRSLSPYPVCTLSVRVNLIRGNYHEPIDCRVEFAEAPVLLTSQDGGGK